MPSTRVQPDQVLRAPPARSPAHGRWALFLDLDGSLAEFAPRPDAALLAEGTRELLERLHERLGGAIALLSGRSLEVVDRMLAPLRLPAAGVHGLERRGAGGATRRVALDPGQVTAVRRAVQDAAARLPGVSFEDKGISFALHYRAVPHQEAAVLAMAEGIADRHRSGYELQRGAQVAELKPTGADKGTALAAFMAEAPFAGRIPVAAGDDWTDEHAFRQAQRLGGFGIVIGRRRPTAARHALADPAALRAWLRRLAG
jgi:trehalose 6-phosphate phosphatase